MPTEPLTEDFSRGAGRAAALLERDHELEELDTILGNAREGRGRLSLIEGPAGVGKTAVLREGRQRAVARGITALSARGGELERDFGFGVVRQLLEPALARAEPREREALLAGAAHLSEPVFATHPGETRDAGAPTHAVLHGLYWLIVNLAERAPLVLAIDDVHWADEPSLRFLNHLARRLDGVRTAIVLARRTGKAADQPELLRSLVLEARPILRLEPLSQTAVQNMVHAALGEQAGQGLPLACHETSGGNPFLLTELLDELRREARQGREVSPALVRRLAPERIAVAILLRVGRLDRRAPALARAVAVLGGDARLADAAELAGLAPDRARALATSLAEAAVLEPGEPPRFVHPIVRAAVYEEMTAGQCGALHGRAARLLVNRGAEPESVAVHLLASQPSGDPDVVATLRAAARSALARGAPEAASRYLRRALAEPPAVETRPALLLELGLASDIAGDDDATGFLRAAYASAGSAEQRAAAALELGRVLGFSAATVGEAARVRATALEDLGDAESPLRWKLEASLLLTARGTDEAQDTVAELLERVDSEFDRLPTPAKRILACPLSIDRAIAGRSADHAEQLARTALDRGALLAEVGPDPPYVHVACAMLTLVGQPIEAEREETAAVAAARRLGSPQALALSASVRSFARWRGGALRDAESDARLALELIGSDRWQVPHYFALASLVSVCVARGLLEEAAAVLEPYAGLVPGESDMRQVAREAQVRLLLARGDAQAALDELRHCEDWARRRRPPASGLVPFAWRSLAAIALERLGEPADALRLANEELSLARRWGDPHKLGVALRTVGQLESRERRIPLLTEAVDTLASSPARLEHAATEVELGSALRRAGKRSDARERLARGMDLAHRCGADALVARAHDELVQAGARPRRPALTGVDALTASERRVAEMAAEGMTNKEIAQALFVTLRTVEMHLSNTYGKLEIASRRELARALQRSS